MKLILTVCIVSLQPFFNLIIIACIVLNVRVIECFDHWVQSYFLLLFCSRLRMIPSCRTNQDVKKSKLKECLNTAYREADRGQNSMVLTEKLFCCQLCITNFNVVQELASREEEGGSSEAITLITAFD